MAFELLICSYDSFDIECNISKSGEDYQVLYLKDAEEFIPSDTFMSLEDACARMMQFWFNEFAGSVETDDPIAYINGVNELLRQSVTFDKVSFR